MVSANETYQQDFLKIIVWGLKPLCESSNNWKLVKLKSPIVPKFSQVQLKFIIIIVPSKNKFVKSMQIVQSAARIIGETVQSSFLNGCSWMFRGCFFVNFQKSFFSERLFLRFTLSFS